MSKHSQQTGANLHIARSQVGTVDPNGVITAEIIGQFHWDSVNDKLYIAEAADNSSWIHSVDGANVDLNTIHRSSDGKDHSDVVLNNAHRLSDGTDHANVVLNDAHRLSDGKDHADVVLNNVHRISDGKNHSDVVLNNAHRVSSGADHGFINQDVTMTGSPQFADLVVTGNLTVQGTTTTLDTTTLLVEDKNIELGVVTSPTDVTADGGGITLKGATDKTIKWINAKNAWEFNQSIDLLGNNLNTTGVITAGRAFFDNFGFDNNTFFSLAGDLDVTTQSGGVFKFTTNAIRAGLDAVEYVEMGHGGGAGFINLVGDPGLDIRFAGATKATFTDNSLRVGIDATNLLEIGHGGVNAFIIAFGAGGLDFRFEGTTKATFTDAGHLHLLTDLDQRDVLKLKTANNLNDTGMAWEDAFGLFTHAIFRTDTGNNQAGLVFAAGQDANVNLLTNSFIVHGGVGTEGKLEVLGTFQISSGAPGNNKFLRSDAAGLATWGEIGWTRLGTDVVLLNGNDSVGMGAIPDASAKLDVASTTKGFLPPRMTTAEIGAIASPATGLESYDTTINKKKVFTGAEFKTLLTEDLGQVVVQETFASSNVRFFGELALPTAQGWTDIVTGIATIDLVTETVFGEVKQVVRHNDDTGGGSTTSQITLTTQNWIDINAFGASYSGTERLDSVDGGSGFFSGLQANAAENPLATGNRRYGVLFNNNAGNLRLTEADNTGNNVTMDGTSGNPAVLFDEWFNWECVVPAGLGAAEFYINGILTSFVPVFGINGGGLGTRVLVSSGSTAGSNRIVYHDNFGVTIFEEAATKTLLAATMAGDVAQVNIPEGKRDYTIILPDGNPRLIGSVLKLVVNNLGGLISLENQNPAAPEILYNGLRTLVINVAVKQTIEGINTVSSGNVYLGFQTIASKTIGSIVVGGNTTATVIATINTFVDLNLGGNVSEEGNIERFTLTNSTTGEIRYDGFEPVSLILNGLLAAISSGGGQRFNFRFLKNGSPLPSPDNVDIPIEIGTELSSVPIHWPVKAVTGDLFRLQVENADGVSNITIDTLKFAVV